MRIIRSTCQSEGQAEKRISDRARDIDACDVINKLHICPVPSSSKLFIVLFLSVCLSALLLPYPSMLMLLLLQCQRHILRSVLKPVNPSLFLGP